MTIFYYIIRIKRLVGTVFIVKRGIREFSFIHTMYLLYCGYFDLSFIHIYW